MKVFKMRAVSVAVTSIFAATGAAMAQQAPQAAEKEADVGNLNRVVVTAT